MILSIILISLLVILVIFILILIFKLKKSKDTILTLSTQVKTMKLQTSYRFEEDIAFLTYMIGFKCKVYTDLILSPSTELSDTKILKGNDQEEAVKDIVISIIHTLSDEYVQLLFKYFSSESLQEYITELVLNQITSIITDLNKKKLSNFIRSTLKNENITFKKNDIDENQPTNK